MEKLNYLKKIIALTTLSLQIFFANTLYAADHPAPIYIKIDIFASRQDKIYKEIVCESGLHKKSKDNYHLTLAKIEDAKGTNKEAQLRRYLVEELNKTCKNDINSDHAIQARNVTAGRYLVNRAYNHCPIVLFPDATTTATLKGYNQILNTALETFNQKNGTKYQMGADLLPGTYCPHITLADTAWINANCNDCTNNKFPNTRDFIIDKLERNIKRSQTVKKQRTYDFMLQVPSK